MPIPDMKLHELFNHIKRIALTTLEKMPIFKAKGRTVSVPALIQM